MPVQIRFVEIRFINAKNPCSQVMRQGFLLFEISGLLLNPVGGVLNDQEDPQA